MNKYTAHGLAHAARSGKQVLIVTHSQTAARQALLDFDNQLEDASQVTRTNGRQTIKYPTGGTIRAVSMRGHGMRGRNADIVFLDWDVEMTDPMFIETVRHIIVTSPDGEIVRA